MNEPLVRAYLKLTDEYLTVKDMNVTVHQMRTLESMGLAERTSGSLRPYEPHYGWRRTGARQSELLRNGCQTRRFFALLQRTEPDNRKVLLGGEQGKCSPPKEKQRSRSRRAIEERTDARVKERLSDSTLLALVRVKVEEALAMTPTQNLARDLAIILDIPRNTQPL